MHRKGHRPPGGPHLLLHDGHGRPRQQEGLEWHQVPERVLHLIVAGDDVSPGLADGAEEDCPGVGVGDTQASSWARDKAAGTARRPRGAGGDPHQASGGGEEQEGTGTVRKWGRTLHGGFP